MPAYDLKRGLFALPLHCCQGRCRSHEMLNIKNTCTGSRCGLDVRRWARSSGGMLAYSCLLAVLGTASRIEEAGRKVEHGTATPGTKTSVARSWLRNNIAKHIQK